MGEVRYVQWKDLKDKLGEILFNGLLLRCGGQQTFTPAEISALTTEFSGSALVIDMDTCNIMMTLKTREKAEEDGTSTPDSH
jgi:hypothetical protein